MALDAKKSWQCAELNIQRNLLFSFWIHVHALCPLQGSSPPAVKAMPPIMPATTPAPANPTEASKQHQTIPSSSKDKDEDGTKSKGLCE
jgi:hypothetical protein